MVRDFLGTTWYGLKIAIVVFLIFTIPLYIVMILLVGGVAQIDPVIAILLAAAIGLASIPLGFYALGYSAKRMRGTG